jgi:hypothetical protein
MQKTPIKQCHLEFHQHRLKHKSKTAPDKAANPSQEVILNALNLLWQRSAVKRLGSFLPLKSPFAMRTVRRPLTKAKTLVKSKFASSASWSKLNSPTTHTHMA